MHGGTAVEDQLQHRFQVQGIRVRRQRVVLAQGVPGEESAVVKCPSLAQTGGLCERQGGQRNLGELGQVQHAFWVAEGLAPSHQRGWVIANHRENREAQGLAGMRVGAIPHSGGGLGLRALIQSHTSRLNALARVNVRGPWHIGDGRGLGNQLLAHAAVDLQHEAATIDSADAFHADLDFFVQLNQAEHAVGPAQKTEATIIPRRASSSGRGVLGDSGQPHAVHQRCFQPGDLGGGVTGVDRVEVTGHPRERGHVRWCLRDSAQQGGSGSVLDLCVDATSQWWVGWQVGTKGATTNGEAFDHCCDGFTLDG